MYPKMESLIRLCFDKARNVAWLEFRSTPYLTGGNHMTHKGGGVTRVFIGAQQQGGAWQTIGPADATTGQFAPIYLPATSPVSDYFRFQQAVVNSWNNFSSATAAQFAKGWSSQKGLKPLTSANFVVKALKTGFEAIGNYNVHFGSKLLPWTIDDLLDAVAPYRQQGVNPAGLANFDAVLPNPYYDGTYAKKEGNLASNDDQRNILPIPSVKVNYARAFVNTITNQTSVFAYDDVMHNLPGAFARCVSYGFRGDTRGPVDIQQAKFTPNYTRPSHIQQKMTAPGGPTAVHGVNTAVAMDLPRFLGGQFLGEFISTSKSVAIARMFANATWSGNTMIPNSTDGWVYACFVEGAIDIPPRGNYTGQDGTTNYRVPYNEQELAVPGMLEWDDVVACRKVLQGGKFTGPLYVNPALQDSDSTAAPRIYDLLSGKSQGAFI
jgi:hypothetical protein